jgi:hypothetical protein
VCPSSAMLPFVPSSIGDIGTVASILQLICKALNESMGASYEYKCLISELLSFKEALKSVESAVTLTQPTGRIALDIAEEITTCFELLKSFHDRIESYQRLLRKGASWRKIGWTFFKADEVANFRDKISRRKQNVSLFLNVLTM